jgi:hypothetical protein
MVTISLFKKKTMAEVQKAMSDPDFVYVSAEDMGPSQWTSLHNIARTLTLEKMGAFKEYVKNMATLLPCGVCSAHFRKLVVDTLSATTPQEALTWTIDVHNAVNKRLGKPVLSYAQALASIRQNSMPHKCAVPPSTRALASIRQDSSSPTSADCPTLNSVGIVFMVLFIITALVLAAVSAYLVNKRRKGL